MHSELQEFAVAEQPVCQAIERPESSVKVCQSGLLSIQAVLDSEHLIHPDEHDSKCRTRSTETSKFLAEMHLYLARRAVFR